MSFVSAAFAVLYTVALVLRFTVSGRRSLWLPSLLVLSWVFYAWHVPHYLVLIVFSTAVDWAAVRALAVVPATRMHARRLILAVSLVVNLGLLGWFKYAGFLAGVLHDLAARCGLDLPWLADPGIVLPIGISFYTFQSMSYTIDVYRGRLAAEPSFLRVATYVAFFPQLVAGPIVRAGGFLYQLGRRRKPRLAVFLEGGYLIVRGLFLKVVVADNLGEVVNANWAAAARTPGPLAIAVMVMFAGQLFADFAGYSSIARGLALQLGFRLPLNFNAPYLATSFSEFWRRWHITLSTWMRDYLYIPLGGNRRGRSRAYLNLFVVMALSGLWHGAAWTFVIWGAVHGLAVALERALQLGRQRRSRWLGLLWYPVVQGTWILSMGLFRAADLTQARQLVAHAFAAVGQVPDGGLAAVFDRSLALGWWFMMPVVLLHLRTLVAERHPALAVSRWEKAVLAGVMLVAILTLYTTTQQFIYFQF